MSRPGAEYASRRPGRALLTALIVAAALLPRSAAAAEDPSEEKRGYGRDNSELELVIREAYGHIEERLAASGHDVMIEITDFRTVSADALSAVEWGSLVSAPIDRRLQINRAEHSDQTHDLRTVRFNASWVDAPGPSEMEKGFAASPAIRVIREAAKVYAALKSVSLLTSYDVWLSVDGESEAYRAAFLWTGGNTPASVLDFHVADAYVAGFDRVLGETIPVDGAPLWPERRADGLTSQPLPGLKSTQQCAIMDIQKPYDKNPPIGVNNHISGGHKGRVWWEQNCRCDYTCASTCEFREAGVTCYDTGLASGAAHVVSSDSATSTTQVANGATGGASCAAGFVCAAKACLFGLCGLTAQVTVNGASVSFTINGDPIWSVKPSASVACPACQVLPPPPTQPPAGAGGGGVWIPENQTVDGYIGGAGGSCTWRCWPVQDAGTGYSQYCVLQC